MTITNFDKAGLFAKDMCYMNLTKEDLPFLGPDGQTTILQPLRLKLGGTKEERFLVTLFEGSPKLDEVEIIKMLYQELKLRYGKDCMAVFRIEVLGGANELRKATWSDNVYFDIKGK